MSNPFVNRTEEMQCLRKALEYDGKEIPVLVFTGIGGMGKTALRQAFEKHFLKPKRVPYAVLDYDGDPNLRSIEATLRAIRRQLGRHKVKTPVFDYLYARYFELSMGVKISSKNCPPELEDVATILDGIPVVGNVTQIIYGLSQLGLSVKERVKHKEWLYRIRDLEPREVLNLLPEVLGEDLEEAMTTQAPKVLKSSGFRISIFFDAYERLSESQVDDTLHRKLLLLTPHLLRVIFTRDPLPWEHKFSREWKDKITHIPPLDDLVAEDAKLFLKKKKIENPDLQDYFYQLSGGFPLHLELCADICREIEESTGRKPEVQDFEGAAQAADLTEELVNRLLRQLKGNERDLMGLAAYPRWVSEDVLEEISSIPESVSRIFRKLIRLSMFSSHPEIPEAYVIRKEVRDCLLSQEGKKRLWKKHHKTLSAYHKERWEETKSYHHLREAIYHSFYGNIEEAMKFFEEHFWKLIEKFNFSEAEGILEAVPAEVLSDKQRRKVDYARARLLTSIMESQQSLMSAKRIYESLVVSEKDEQTLSQYLFCFGDLLRILGEYEKALEYYQKALTFRLKIYGEEHSDVADSYNYIGNVCYFQGKYEKALEYYQKGLAIQLKVYGDEHPNVAFFYNNIGPVYEQKGEYEKALECFQKGLAIQLKVYGDEHPNVAFFYNNIGCVYYEQAEYGKALEYYQKALGIWLKVYGDEHPDVAASYDNIGLIYDVQVKYEKALECFQKGLAIKLKVYGEKHPDVATSYNNIGIVYYDLGEHGKAMDYHQKSLDIRRMVYGEEHPTVAGSYSNIGCVYDKKAKYGKALEYHQKALAIRLKVYGKEHPAVADSYEEISSTFWVLKKEEEAIEKMRRSVDIFRKFNLWKDVLECLDTLEGWLREMGKKKEAEKVQKEAERIRKEQELQSKDKG